MRLLPSGLIIDGDPYYSPHISLSPFHFWSRRRFDNIDDHGMAIFESAFRESSWRFVESGKSAISISLSQLNLNRVDEVWIQTSSGNSYVSKCVTEEISKFCNWSMHKSIKTKAIYIIHEFGRDTRELVIDAKVHGLPIIEDSAYGLLTALAKNWRFGDADFSIFSFPKAFEMQFGGILLSNTNIETNTRVELLDLITRAATHWVANYKEIAESRMQNFRILEQRFRSFGHQPTYTFGRNEVPGIFMFDVDESVNLVLMKEFLNAHGCESTIFYGRSSYILPVHQNLRVEHIDYFAELVAYFTRKDYSV